MGKTELDDLLAQLHERLRAAGSIDADDRQRLTTTLRDIEAVLRERGTRHENAHGLEGLAVRFEVDHPALAEGVRRLADLLGKAGI